MGIGEYAVALNHQGQAYLHLNIWVVLFGTVTIIYRRLNALIMKNPIITAILIILLVGISFFAGWYIREQTVKRVINIEIEFQTENITIPEGNNIIW